MTVTCNGCGHKFEWDYKLNSGETGLAACPQCKYLCNVFAGLDDAVRVPVQPVSEVEHPSHYGGASNPYEHVKVAEAMGWDRDAYLYQATKYVWRLGLKDGVDPITDLEKSIWFLRRKLKRMREGK